MGTVAARRYAVAMVTFGPELLQWPAMLATLVSTWLVASHAPARRRAGFWLFLVSNGLWVAWGWSQHAPALVVMQLGLAVLNLRGAERSS